MKNVNTDLDLWSLMYECIQVSLEVIMSIRRTACSLTSVSLPLEFTTHSRKIVF